MEDMFFLTDPGGFLYNLPPTRKLIRYDQLANHTEIFIDWNIFDFGPDLIGTVTYSNYIIVAPDNRTLFVSIEGLRQNNVNTLPISLLKIDIKTKKILGHFSFKMNENGHVNQRIFNMSLGVYNP